MLSMAFGYARKGPLGVQVQELVRPAVQIKIGEAERCWHERTRLQLSSVWPY
jgi:hypothetical protein